jgi:hypothetical protein
MQTELTSNVGANRDADTSAHVFCTHGPPVHITDSVSDVHADFDTLIHAIDTTPDARDDTCANNADCSTYADRATYAVANNDSDTISYLPALDHPIGLADCVPHHHADRIPNLHADNDAIIHPVSSSHAYSEPTPDQIADDIAVSGAVLFAHATAEPSSDNGHDVDPLAEPEPVPNKPRQSALLQQARRRVGSRRMLRLSVIGVLL